jgi:hypothetical protein
MGRSDDDANYLEAWRARSRSCRASVSGPGFALTPGASIPIASRKSKARWSTSSASSTPGTIGARLGAFSGPTGSGVNRANISRSFSWRFDPGRIRRPWSYENPRRRSQRGDEATRWRQYVSRSPRVCSKGISVFHPRLAIFDGSPSRIITSEGRMRAGSASTTMSVTRASRR